MCLWYLCLLHQLLYMCVCDLYTGEERCCTDWASMGRSWTTSWNTDLADCQISSKGSYGLKGIFLCTYIFIAGDSLAQGRVWQVLQWWLLHYSQHLQREVFWCESVSGGLRAKLNTILLAGIEVWCPLLDWTVLYSGWVWYSSLQDCGAGHTGKLIASVNIYSRYSS